MGDKVFEILINESFEKINSDKFLSPVNNKNVLSLINNFEDGYWCYSKFQNFIWDNISETALSFEERESLVDKSHTTLTAAAKNLRLTDQSINEKGQGSELAEIFLYGVMKHYYNSLPVVPKIFYKQNTQDNAKGADSVHIVIENDKDFSIWFGEAKFYNNIENKRLSNIVSSVENSLKSEKIKKENSIITNISDIDHCVKDKKLNKKIKEILSSTNTSLDELKPKLHVPILLLHECSITNSCSCLTDNYKNKIINFHKDRAESYFKKQIKQLAKSIFKYSDIKFHIILFPVPNKKNIVEKFIDNVKHYKNQ